MAVRRKALWLVMFAIGGAALLWAVPAGANEVTLGLARDDGLVQYRYTAQGLWTGPGYFWAGNASNGYGYRSMAAFDVDALTADGYDPSTHVITGLTLEITLKDAATGGSNNTISIYAVSQADGDWEFTSNNQDTVLYDIAWGETYTDALDSHTYADDPAGTVTTFTFAGLDSADMTTLINSWITGNNAGLIFIGNEMNPPSGNNYAKYTPGSQQLVVEYSAVPEPATMVVLGLGSVGLLWRRARRRRS